MIRPTATKLVATAAAVGTALVVTAGAGAAQAEPARPSAEPRAVATCGTPDLRIGFHERLGGGMSHAGGTLEFRNASDHACALRGYPGLGLENARHSSLPTRTVWGSTWYADDPGNKVVRLQPGEAAQANVAWTHSGTEAHQADYLRVTPPGARTYHVIALGDMVDRGELHVTAVAHKVPVRG
ncbi:DUF4232 domain-containing protein [Streptomyces sp. ISL-11]|uniref:DUF4232 domain-containing protein n=1 Tax=Streptomyces sp. ISL-11 TaxID=2819174 RepID=UPI001BE6B721|nr:DUF4232 domain-containing protein [Streptomyces sp. ISL-11]MBT2382868.1 DUF4232 domain-containing protein [Streptomyces sp. ISL-11]